MQIQFVIWEYFINFLEMLLFYIFIHTKLHLADNFKHIRLKQFGFLLIQFFVLCMLNYMDLSSMITVSISCLLDITFALLFYSDAFVMRIFWGSMYSVICLISEYITVFVPQTFSKITSLELLFGGTLRIPFTMLYIALIAVIVFLFHCIADKKIQLSIMQKISYFVISIAGILIGHYIMLLTLESEDQFHNSDFTFQLILVNLFFLILFIFLLIYIYQLGYSKAVNTALLEQQKMCALEEMEYQSLIHTTESLREMKHDIDIHLDVIQSLSASGNLDDLQSYINSYHHSLAHTHHLLSTGNTAIDCILSTKIDSAQKLNIETDFSILAPQDFPLDALSLSSLLGNMWNNAMEACQRLQKNQPDIHPFIHFYIKPFQHMILIHMENNYDEILLQNDTYLSIKKEGSHGIGLKRMADIVAKAEGILQINSEKNVFTVHIMIPQKEEPNENRNFNSRRSARRS